MNFDKAFAELMKGKKIRRKEWEPFMHVKLEGKHVKTYKGEYTNFYNKADVLISDGWLVLNGDGQELTFLEALEQLKAKKWIVSKEWVEKNIDAFIFVDHDQLAMCKAVEFDFMPTYKCLCAQDWEIMK